MKFKSGILIYLFLAVAAVSCVRKSDIDNLQEQIDDLKAGRIATIEKQIANINASIADLQSADTRLASLVSSLQQETSDIKSDLSSREEALAKRIDALEKYVEEELGKATDWVSATFATLKQYQDMLTELEGIKESIKGLDTDISKDIEDAVKASETSMKGWVSGQLAGYYTMAQMDVKLKALADSDAAAQKSMTELAESLASAKTELTSAYTRAIADAIANHDGTITAKIAADIKAATDALQDRIDALELRIAALEGMIQSITVIPAYPDGSVAYSRAGVLSIDCIISPASAVKNLTKENFTLLTNIFLTKTDSNSSISILSAKVNNTTGKVNVRADISSFVYNGLCGNEFAVSLCVNSGASQLNTSFVKATVFTPGYVDLGLSVKWAQCNLGALRAEEYGDYYQWAGVKDITSSSNFIGLENCPYHHGSVSKGGWEKYIPAGMQEYWDGRFYDPDDRTTLEPDDDAACAAYGEGWHIPTLDEWNELLTQCTRVWTSVNGVDGLMFTSSKTLNSIFLPVAGFRSTTKLYFDGLLGRYWSSSLYLDYPDRAFHFFMDKDKDISQSTCCDHIRCEGLSVRPVVW